jgi:predicted transcriptional regulator
MEHLPVCFDVGYGGSMIENKRHSRTAHRLTPRAYRSKRRFADQSEDYGTVLREGTSPLLHF